MPMKKSQGPDFKLMFIATVFALGLWYYARACLGLG